MINAELTFASSECEQMLTLLSTLDTSACIRSVLHDADEIRRLLRRYSFRSPYRAERLCEEIASRYRPEFMDLYGGAVLPSRQSDSCYLRLEQLLALLARIAAMRLCRAGVLSLSCAQLTLGDGMLLHLLTDQIQKKGG